MSRARMTPTDYRASVVAVPPIALDKDLKPALEPNVQLIRHIESGGVKSVLFGGNANLYNFDLGRYGEALALMDAAASASTHVITSVGPDFGKLTDQLPLVERSAIRNVMLLPMTFPVDSTGLLRGIRSTVDRLGFGIILYIKRDNYISADVLAKAVVDGSVVFVKYAVEREEPAADPYLELDPLGRRPRHRRERHGRNAGGGSRRQAWVGHVHVRGGVHRPIGFQQTVGALSRGAVRGSSARSRALPRVRKP